MIYFLNQVVSLFAQNSTKVHILLKHIEHSANVMNPNFLKLLQLLFCPIKYYIVWFLSSQILERIESQSRTTVNRETFSTHNELLFLVVDGNNEEKRKKIVKQEKLFTIAISFRLLRQRYFLLSILFALFVLRKNKTLHLFVVCCYLLSKY